MKESEELLKRANQSSREFARECFGEPNDVDIYVATQIRCAIAELGEIPPSILRASDRFRKELRDLPFWSDYENKIFCDRVTDIIGFNLTEKQSEGVPSPEFSSKEFTIGQFVKKYRDALDKSQEDIICQWKADLE